MQNHQQVKYESANRLIFINNGFPYLYVPTYIYLSVKNLKNLDFKKLNVEANLKLTLVVRTKGLPQQIKQVLEQQMIMFFNRDSSIKLQPGLTKDSNNKQIIVKKFKHFSQRRNKKEWGEEEEEEDGIKFEISNYFNLKMNPFIRLSPFEIIDLIFSIGLRKINYKRKMVIKFTFQSTQPIKNGLCTNICFKKNETILNYDLAEKRLVCEFSKYPMPKSLIYFKKAVINREIFDSSIAFLRTISKEQEKKQSMLGEKKSLILKIKDYKYAHFHMPVYKYPETVLSQIFFPLFPFALINIFINFQSTKFDDRLANSSAILVAFIAFISTIREEIPPTSQFTMMEILILLLSSTPILILIRSLQIRDLDERFDPQLYNGFFIASLIIDCMVFAFIVILYLVHKIKWQGEYNLQPEQVQFNKISDLQQWSFNDKANKCFQQIARELNKPRQRKKFYYYSNTNQQQQRLFQEQLKQIIGEQ